MSGFKYICKVAEAYPYDYEQPPICKVELWDFSRANECEEARIEAVATVASLSYGNEQAKDPEKLYKMLIEKGHESPFEFVRFLEKVHLRGFGFATYRKSYPNDCGYHKARIATFKLKVPIFVARQIMRHRAFSYLEMSRRFVTPDKVPFEFWRMNEDAVQELVDEYNELIQEGVRAEVARAFLPLAAYTQFWMQGDYEAWFNFFIHRLAPEAQEETRLVAQAMWDLLKEHQHEIVDTMKRYLHIWVKDCNHMFTPAREKKAEWFKENLL